MKSKSIGRGFTRIIKPDYQIWSIYKVQVNIG